MHTFIERAIGAARLDVAIYEEVEADTSGTGQATAMVILSSIAGGVGAAGIGGLRPGVVVTGALLALVGWAAWAVLTYVLGTKVFPEPQTRSDVGELLRTTGFAAAPGLIRVAGIVPGLGLLAILGAQVWMLAAMIVAVRQALDYTSTMRAVLVCGVGFILSLAIAFVGSLLTGAVVS